MHHLRAEPSVPSRQADSDQEGMVLIAVLLTVTFLLGVVGAGVATMETRNRRLLSEVRHYRALLAAEAGIDEAIHRAVTGEMASGSTRNGTVASGQTYVISAHSFGHDGLDNDGDSSIDEPDENVLMVTSQGRFGGERHTLRTYLGASYDPPSLGAAITVFGTPTTEVGGAASVAGENTDPDGSRGDFTEDGYGFGVMPPATVTGFNSNLRSIGASNITGVNGSPSTGQLTQPINLTEMVEDMRAGADYHLARRRVSSADLGTLAAPRIVFRDGDLGLSSVTGAGVLVVTGDLFLTGNFEWTGMVIVLGNLVSVGTVEVLGGLLQGPAATEIKLAGTENISYSKLGLNWVPNNRYDEVLSWHDAAHSAIGSTP